MTKTTTKANAATPQSTTSAPLMVLGYDEDQKPRGARFQGADSNLVAKTAQLMDLKVYEATTEELSALTKKLTVGRLYSNGKGFVPNIRQNLYSQIIVALAPEPRAAVGKDEDQPAVASGLPRSWDEIAPGHLVIAQETLEYGWWKPSSSSATATCSRCGFGTSRSCPSSHAIARQSRWLAPRREPDLLLPVSDHDGGPANHHHRGRRLLCSNPKSTPSPGPSSVGSSRAVAANGFALASSITPETTMTTKTKSHQTERIRALNDDLRQNLGHGRAVMTPGAALADRKLSPVSSKQSKSTTTFATPTIRTKNMTLARSRRMAIRSFSRSTTMMRP